MITGEPAVDGVPYSAVLLRFVDAALEGDEAIIAAAQQIGREVGADHAWMQRQIDIFAAPWMREFLVHDPRPGLAALTGPVLALYGERDLRVSSADADTARAALNGNRAADVRVVPGVGHMMQQVARLDHLSDTGPAPSDAVIRIIAEWAKMQPPLDASPCAASQ